MHQSVIRGGNLLNRRQFYLCLGRTHFLFPQKTVFPVFPWLELKHRRCPSAPEHRRASWADQTRTELSRQRGAKLQHQAKLPCPRPPHSLAVSQFHNRAVTQWAVPPLAVPQLRCIIVELLALSSVSSFTAPQIGDVCWHWNGTNNYQLVISWSDQVYSPQILTTMATHKGHNWLLKYVSLCGLYRTIEILPTDV